MQSMESLNFPYRQQQSCRKNNFWVFINCLNHVSFFCLLQYSNKIFICAFCTFSKQIIFRLKIILHVGTSNIRDSQELVSTVIIKKWTKLNFLLTIVFILLHKHTHERAEYQYCFVVVLFRQDTLVPLEWTL